MKEEKEHNPPWKRGEEEYSPSGREGKKSCLHCGEGKKSSAPIEERCRKAKSPWKRGEGE